MTIEGVQFFNLPEARNLQNAVGYDEYIVGAYQIIMQFSMEAYFNTGQIPQKVLAVNDLFKSYLSCVM